MIVLSSFVQSIINNDEGYYEGKLWHYLYVLVACKQNQKNGYHNPLHGLHILEMCYLACLYYKKRGVYIAPRVMRNLLIAALLHDLNHRGTQGDDSVNIQRAVDAIRECLLKHDVDHFEYIVSLITRATQFPHTIPTANLTLFEKILREADMSQVFADNWYEQVVIGFSKEWNRNPLQILELQQPFLEKLWEEWNEFGTDWVKYQFPRTKFNLKIQEVHRCIHTLAA